MASYLAYLAAFLTIGIIWLNHRALVDKVRRFDTTLHWLNLALLLGVATLPFPTSLLAAYLRDGGVAASTAAVVYGLLSVATALPWRFIWGHLVGHPELLETPYDVAHARAGLRRATIGPLIYAVAVPIALVAPLVALLFFIAIAAVYAVTNPVNTTRRPARRSRFRAPSPTPTRGLRTRPAVRRLCIGLCSADDGHNLLFWIQAGGHPVPPRPGVA